MNNKRSKNKTKKNIKKIMKGGTLTQLQTYLMNLNSDDDKNIAEASDQILLILNGKDKEAADSLLSTKILNNKRIHHLAAKLDDIRISKYIFDRVKKDNLYTLTDDDGNTPFHYATLFGKTEILQYMYDKFIPSDKIILITKYNNKKKTPLHLACQSGNINTIAKIIEFFKNLRYSDELSDGFFNYLDSSGLSPICYFIKNVKNKSDENIINGIKLLTDNGSYMGIIGQESTCFRVWNENFPQYILCKYSTEYVIDKIFSTYDIKLPRGNEKSIFHHLVIRNFHKIIQKFMDNDNPYPSTLSLDKDEKGAMTHMLLFRTDDKGFVPLHYACSENVVGTDDSSFEENEKLETVKVIIEEYEKLLHFHFTTPIWLEISSNAPGNIFKITPIMQACISRLSIIFKFLFDKLKPEDKIKLFKQKDMHGKTLLHIVCKNNDEKIFDILDQHIEEDSFIVNMKDKEFCTPLHWAAMYNGNSTKLIKKLISKGADMYSYNGMRLLPIHHAIKKGNVENVKAFFDNGLSIDHIRNSNPLLDNDTHTFIHMICHEFLGNNVSVSKHNLIDILGIILEKDKIPTKIEQKPDGTRNIKDVSDRKFDIINKINSAGKTALDMAVEASTETSNTNQLETIEKLVITLINYGANLNSGNTPILCVALDKEVNDYYHQKEYNVIKILIKNRADMNAKDDDGDTPLHVACIYGNINFVSEYIDTYKDNLNLNIKNNEGLTPLMLACKNSHVSIVKILLDNDANFQEKDLDGHTAFYNCLTNYRTGFTGTGSVNLERSRLKENKISILKQLIEKGADINVKSNTGRTPLHKIFEMYNASGGGTPHIDTLLEILKEIFIKNEEFDINIKNNLGISPFHYLCKKNRNENIIKLLLDTGVVNVNITDNNMLTPLHYLCKYSYKNSIAKLLLDNGASLDSETDFEELDGYGNMVNIRKKPLEYLIENANAGFQFYNQEREELEKHIRVKAIKKYKNDEIGQRGGSKGYSDFDKHIELVEVIMEGDLDKLKNIKKM